MAYKTVIFDMDGTVLNTLEDMADSMNHVLMKMGYPARTVAEVRQFVGNGLYLLCERACPAGTPVEKIKEAHRMMVAYYADHCAVKTAPYAGILECLRTLRAAGVKTAVVSNKADFAVQTLAADMFEGLFDIALGEREGIPKKPAPDGVYYALRELHADGADAVYVGDSDVDLATAKNAGLPVLAVTWGFRDRDFLLAHGADPADFVDTAAELTRRILR